MNLWCQEPTRVPMERMLRVCNALRTRRRVGQPPKLRGQSRYPSHQATRRSTTDNFSATVPLCKSRRTGKLRLWGKLRHNFHLGFQHHHAEHGFVGSLRMFSNTWLFYHILIFVHGLQRKAQSWGEEKDVSWGVCALASQMFELFAFLFFVFFSIEHLHEVHYFHTDSINQSLCDSVLELYAFDQRQQPWHRWWKGASKMGVPGGLQIGIWEMAAVFVIYFYDIQ